jgi:hypothetical protein
MLQTAYFCDISSFLDDASSFAPPDGNPQTSIDQPSIMGTDKSFCDCTNHQDRKRWSSAWFPFKPEKRGKQAERPCSL